MRPATLNALALLLTLLTALGGCNTVPEAERARLIIDHEQAQKIGYSVIWGTDLRLPENGRLGSVTLVGDQLIVLEKGNNLVTALSASDGSIVWRREIGTKLERLITAFGEGESVYLSSEWRVFRLRPSDGTVTGVSVLQEAVTTGPAVSTNRAVFGGTTGLVFAHDLTAGRSAWSYQLSSGIVARPVALGNSVLVTTAGGVYAMLAIDRGELQWPGRTFGRISAISILNNQGVWIPSEDGTLYALQRIDGRDRWKYPATRPLTRDPLMDRTSIYLPIKGRGLVALHALNGNELWERKDVEALPVAVTPKGLLLNDRTKMLFLDSETGKSLREAPTLWLQDIIVGPGDSLYLVSPYGKLQRLAPRA